MVINKGGSFTTGSSVLMHMLMVIIGQFMAADKWNNCKKAKQIFYKVTTDLELHSYSSGTFPHHICRKLVTMCIYIYLTHICTCGEPSSFCRSVDGNDHVT